MSESNSTQFTIKAEQVVLTALQGLRYGTVEITVHDSQIVEVTRKERQRLETVSKSTDR